MRLVANFGHKKIGAQILMNLKKTKASISRKCQYIWLLLLTKYFIISFVYKQLFSPRLWNTGLVSSGASLASWGGGSSLALVGHASSNGVTIKMPYGVDVLHRPASHPIFSYWLVKTESGFIVRSVETGLGRWTLVVAVISVDAYPFSAFSDLTCHLEDMGIGVFWFLCAAWE